MSIYWYLQARLRLRPDAPADAADRFPDEFFSRPLGGEDVEGPIYDSDLHDADMARFDGLDGVRARDGNLEVGLFCTNLMHREEDDDEPPLARLFAWLGTVCEGEVGEVVGRLRHEEYDVGGPLVWTRAGVRFMPVSASPSWERILAAPTTPDILVPTALPERFLTVGGGVWLGIDVEGLRAWAAAPEPDAAPGRL